MALGDKLPVVMGKEKAVAGGVATLDADGKLVAAQKPAYTGEEIPVSGTDGTSLSSALSNKADKNSQVEWYDLPLVNAEIYNVAPVYGKSETGIVYVSGAVRFETSPVAAQVIATLPEGYRPSKSHVIQLVSSRGNDGSTWATFGYVTPNGNIQFFNGTLPNNYWPDYPVSFSTSFPC